MVIALTALTFILVYRNTIKPLNGFLSLSLIFLITGILTSQEILSGFANESVVCIALLILITAGIRSHFPIDKILDSIFSRVRSYQQFIWVMMGKISMLSSFVNNTPVVALMTPYVFKWGKKNKISPSKLLIPLSYAAICGGMITVIGTSTNLILNGFLSENDLPKLNPYHLLIIGVLVSLGCILFISVVGHRFLPNNKDLVDEFERNKREYLIEKSVSKTSPLIGKSISSAGLRNMKGVYLVEIVRNKSTISPVSPDEKLQANDTLIFAGETNNIMEFTSSELGLALPKSTSKTSAMDKGEVVEIVIGTNNSIVGKTVKESEFRNRYDAAVVAIHRNGERLSGKLGDIQLRSGDVLLLFTGNDFLNRVDLYKDLIIISDIERPSTIAKKNSKLFLLVSLGSIALIPAGIASLFQSLLIILTFMLVSGLISMKNIKRDLDISMMLILVLSLALGQAIVKTSTGLIIANGILNILQPLGPIAILVGLMMITIILTTFVTNVGAVAIMFPIAYSISTSLGLNDSPFYLAIAYGASAAFLSPISYQTNLIIYGPGGYNFKDFLRIGLPTTIIYLFISTTTITLLYRDILL